MKNLFHQRVLLAFPFLMGLFLCFGTNANDRLGPFNTKPRSVRTRAYDQRHIVIQLELDWDTETIQGKTTLTLVPFESIESIELDAADMKIESVFRLKDNNSDEKQNPKLAEAVKLKFKQRRDKLMITLDQEAEVNKPVRIAIEYKITKPEDGGHFVLPDAMEPDQAKMFWTQSESVYARNWFPCLDSPSDRLTSETIVTVPKNYFVLSNGTLKSKSKPKNGKRTYHWVQKKSHAPYLISVVAGDFEAYEQEWDGIPIIAYVPRGRLKDAERSFGKTPEMVKLFSEKIGFRYPWAKYTQICVDEYSWGGMEHTSATTLTQRTLHDERAELDDTSIDLVSHELAHQWWGDLITCKDWGELWLNEGFATYFEIVWVEHDRGSDAATWKNHEDMESYKREDKNRYRRPIATYRYPNPDAMFDRHTYPKGACVLHMLRHVVGEQLFWRGIQRYAYENQYSVVETSDLRKSFERATGYGLNWFFDEWIHHGGHPEYKVAYNYNAKSKSVELTVKQTQEVDDLTPLFRMPIDIEIVTPSKTIHKRIQIEKKEEVFSFEVPEQPDRVLFDPDNWVLKNLDFEKSEEEYLNQLQNDKHLMCRYRAIRGLAKMKKDDDIVKAMTQAATSDSFWAIREAATEILANFGGKEIRKTLIQIAKNDTKSDVRIAAIEALKDFPHAETNKTLRNIIANDRSYEAVAKALTTLSVVDAENCIDDLRAALKVRSEDEVILEAAAYGLAELKDNDSLHLFLQYFEKPSTAKQRAAVLPALVKLYPEAKETVNLLLKQLQSERQWYRMRAVEALARTGDVTLIPTLLEQKSKETSQRALRNIDEAVKMLREGSSSNRILKKRIEKLEREQRSLRKKLKKLSEAKN